MKYGLFLLAGLLASTEVAWAQGLDGTFVSGGEGPVTFFGESFRFQGDQFDYRASGCTDFSFGKGHYAVRDDIIWLYFERVGPAGTVWPMVCAPGATQLPDAHSTHFCFAVTDATSGQPLEGITIRSQQHPTLSTKTNDAGEAVLTFEPQPADSIVVEDRRQALRMVLAIGSEARQGFAVALPQPYQIKAGTIYTYALGKRNKQGGVVDFLGIPAEPGRLYMRVSEKELRRHPIF